MAGSSLEYLQANTVDQALRLLDNNPGAEVLAAGQSLVPTLDDDSAKHNAVVDISSIDALQAISFEDNVAYIGALATYRAVEETELLQNRATGLTEAVSNTADPQVRNNATLGGNIVTQYPVSDLSASLITSGATIVTANSTGERRIAGDDLLSKTGSAKMADDELLVRIEVPLTPDTAGGAYQKAESPVSRYTLIGVAARLSVDAGIVSSASVAANGVMTSAVRLDPVANALEGQPLEQKTIERAASCATDHLDESEIRDDGQASAAYRARLLPSYTQRAVRQAAERAGVSFP